MLALGTPAHLQTDIGKGGLQRFLGAASHSAHFGGERRVTLGTPDSEAPANMARSTPRRFVRMSVIVSSMGSVTRSFCPYASIGALVPLPSCILRSLDAFRECFGFGSA